MNVVHDSPFYRVELEHGFVRARRSDRPYPDLASLDAEHADLQRVLSTFRGLPLIVDLRDARGRNDADFEERMRVHRQMLFRGAPRACVLVRSAAGILHVRRHLKEDGLEERVAVTNDPTEAVAYVRGDLPQRP